MTSPDRRRSLTALAGLALPWIAGGASAADAPYPGKVVKVVVPFGAGSSTDYMGRLVIAGLNQAYPGRFIVENMPGAAAGLGAAYVGKAAADGATLMYTTATPFVINPFVYRRLAYDPQALVPVARTVELPLVLAVGAGLGIKTFADLRKHLEKNRRTASFSSYGAGTSSHIAGSVLASKLGLPDLLHVPYKDARAVTDLVAGRNTFHFEAWSSVKPLVESGQLVVVATSSSRRSAWAADVPTVASAISEEYDVATWHGLFAPVGTPAAIIRQLNAALREQMARAEVQARCHEMGFNPYPPLSPEEFAAFVKGDVARWQGLVKAANIQPE